MTRRRVETVLLACLMTSFLSPLPVLAGADIRHELAADASADRIEKDIRKLVSFGTRHTLSETQSESRGIGAARRWIESEFRSISADCGGCLEVLTVSDIVSGEKRIPEPTEVVTSLPSSGESLIRIVW